MRPIQPLRRPQHLGVFHGQDAEPGRPLEHAAGRGIEDRRLARGVNKLKVLRDEFDVDEAADMLINLFWRGLKGAPADKEASPATS